jgi:hypothetical protein
VAANEAARWANRLEAAGPASQPAADRLGQIAGQLEQLRAAVEALREELGRANEGEGEGPK